MKNDTSVNSKDVSRRGFIAATAGGVGGLMLSSGTARGAEGEFFDPYELVPLGKTGLKISRVGFGTGYKGWMRQSNQTRMGKEEFQKLLRYAFDQGIRFFDLADLYGTHPYLIPALKDLPRKDYVIATKVWTRKNGIPEKERPAVDLCVERFLKELGTDYIDVQQIHCVTSGKWAAEVESYMEGLEKLKKKGTIRCHGVSCHAIPALETLATTDWVDTVHTRVNPYGVKMDKPPEKVVPALKKIYAAGKGVIGMKIIGEGAFRDDEEKKNNSITQALTGGYLSGMIVGFMSNKEIDDFAARVRKVKRPKSE